MKRTVKRLLAVLLACVMVFGAAAGLTEQVQAAYVEKTGGATRKKATVIAVSGEHDGCYQSLDFKVHLTGTQEVFFKFRTAGDEGDSGRFVTQLQMKKNSYGGKFYAFLGSATRMDDPDHDKWDSESCGGHFRVLFCNPDSEYYIWLRGSDAALEGDVYFSLYCNADDVDGLDDAEDPTPITLSSAMSGLMNSHYYGDEYVMFDRDWYSFNTRGTGKTTITLKNPVKREWWEDGMYDPEVIWYGHLTARVYDAKKKLVGEFAIESGKTVKKTFSLNKNAKYYLEIDSFSDDVIVKSEEETGEQPYMLQRYDFRIDAVEAISVGKAKVTYQKKWTYTGKAIKPAVKVTYGGKTLKVGTDYKVSYVNNTNIGQGTIKVIGKGDYVGTKKAAFAIYPKKQAIASLTSPKAKKVTVKIKKVGQADGWKISYSLTSDFKKSKEVEVGSTSKTFTLTSGKTYYFCVCGYGTLSSGKRIYGQWSTVKSVKVL